MFLAYGNDRIKLSLPPDVSSRELNINNLSPLAVPLQSIKQALQQPLGTLPLQQLAKKGERVCLLVNDSTRVARSELFLPLIVNELLSAGIKKRDIFIVFANGNHRSLSEEEMVNLVGADVAANIAMYNHDCRDEEYLVYFGNTSRGTPIYINKLVAEADRRILTGSIVYHFFAGFGGGRKALVPGVAGFETIKQNHSLMLNKNARLGCLENNPVHEDQIEGARMVGADFLLNVVLNEKKDLLGVFAGDMDKAHRAGCSLVEKVYGVNIDTPQQVVIASCGGYPKDINLYQAQKTLENAVQAVEKGGKIVLLAQCSEGVGSDIYEEWAKKHSSLDAMGRALKENFQLGGHKAYAVGRALNKAEVVLVSNLHSEKVKELGFVPAASLEEALEHIYNDYGSSFSAYIIPQGSLTVPVWFCGIRS